MADREQEDGAELETTTQALRGAEARRLEEEKRDHDEENTESEAGTAAWFAELDPEPKPSDSPRCGNTLGDWAGSCCWQSRNFMRCRSAAFTSGSNCRHSCTRDFHQVLEAVMHPWLLRPQGGVPETAEAAVNAAPPDRAQMRQRQHFCAMLQV